MQSGHRATRQSHPPVSSPRYYSVDTEAPFVSRHPPHQRQIPQNVYNLRIMRETVSVKEIKHNDCVEGSSLVSVHERVLKSNHIPSC